MRITLTIEYKNIDPNSPDADRLFDGWFSPNGLDELKDTIGADFICVEDCDAGELK